MIQFELVIGGTITALLLLNAYGSWQAEDETRARLGPGNEWRVRPMTLIRLRVALWAAIVTLIVASLLLFLGVR